MAVAERDGGWVINADALQVYRCWRVLTARPADADLTRAPHHLFGHVDCTAHYSVGDWIREVAPIIAEARWHGQRPIIVGGTGLYLTALTSGLADVPPVPPEVRRQCSALLATEGLGRLLADLARDDPQTHRDIDRQNPARVRRAWEVFVATGTGLADWRNRATTPVLASAEIIGIVATSSTCRLDARIRDRFEAMVVQGAVEECRRFRASGIDPAAPAARALGASQLIAHLDGAMTLPQAVSSAVVATRQYAKRQRTWFRTRMGDWIRLDPTAAGALDLVPRH